MASYIERRIFECKPDRIFECLAVGHQSGRSQHAFPMRVNDSGVHIAREPEIVGINNQPLQTRNLENMEAD